MRLHCFLLYISDSENSPGDVGWQVFIVSIMFGDSGTGSTHESFVRCVVVSGRLFTIDMHSYIRVLSAPESIRVEACSARIPVMTFLMMRIIRSHAPDL